MDLLEITGLIVIPGIALLAAIVIGIIQIRQNSQKTKNPKVKETTVEEILGKHPDNSVELIELKGTKSAAIKPTYRTDITPAEIGSQLENLPPYQAETIKNTFKGILVEWKLLLSTISIVSKNTIRLNLISSDNRYPIVSSNIKIDDYPDIRITKKGSLIAIKGKINKVDSLLIELIDASLSFPSISDK